MHSPGSKRNCVETVKRGTVSYRLHYFKLQREALSAATATAAGVAYLYLTHN